MKHEFTSIESLQLENSFTVLKAEDNIKLNVSVEVSDTSNYGNFEIYDEESGGENWYAEGGLWFEGKKLVDYDGVFDLPICIKDKLAKLGYDCSFSD